MADSRFTLVDCLQYFLADGMTEMPVVTARVVRFRPLKLTDDDHHFVDISSEDDTLRHIERQANKVYFLTLLDWKFTSCRVPNTDAKTIDLRFIDYKLTWRSKKVDDPDFDLFDSGLKCLTSECSIR